MRLIEHKEENKIEIVNTFCASLGLHESGYRLLLQPQGAPALRRCGHQWLPLTVRSNRPLTSYVSGKENVIGIKVRQKEEHNN